MRKIFCVDRMMCGGDMLPDDFDLDEFCEKLQGKLSDIEVVPVHDDNAGLVNRDRDLVSPSIFDEALGEYLHQ